MNRDYVENLERPLTIEKLKPLIGAVFDVNIKRKSWGVDKLDVDKLVVTNIKLTVDVESGQEAEEFAGHIYMDFWLDGDKKYNAWVGLSQFKEYVATGK